MPHRKMGYFIWLAPAIRAGDQRANARVDRRFGGARTYAGASTEHAAAAKDVSPLSGPPAKLKHSCESMGILLWASIVYGVSRNENMVG